MPARRVWSTNFITLGPPAFAGGGYICPAGMTMVLKNMTFTFNGTPNGHGFVLQICFGLPSCVVWEIGAANAQARTYQWEGRETYAQPTEGPFEPTIYMPWMDTYSSFTANGFLLN